MASRLSQTFTLTSGHKLGFAEYGDEDGLPIFFFHGFAGSRLQIPQTTQLANQLGIRIVAVDRPGTGLSDPHIHLSLLDWADESIQLADALGVKKFGITAWSAGGPHALALAYKFPDRVTKLSLAAPMGRWFVGQGATRYASRESRILAIFARSMPWILPILLRGTQKQVEKNPSLVVVQQIKQMPKLDQEMLNMPENNQLLGATIGEAFVQGTTGLVSDILRVSMPWGFEVEKINTPTWIWQGSADTIVLPALTHELSERMQYVQYNLLQDEGHFSLFRHWPDMLEVFVR